MAGSFYDVLKVLNKYIGEKDAHKKAVDYLKANNFKMDMETPWCTEFAMAIMHEANCLDLIGTYSQGSGSVKRKATEKGIYHSGSSGIMPGDIVLYGKNGKPNHVEYAIGASLNVSGNYTLHGHNGAYYRKRSGRTIVGYVRPKYSSLKEFNDLDNVIFSSFILLGFYASGQTRSNLMSFVFGKNTDGILKEYNRINDNTEKIIFNLAVFTIAGFAGRNDYRKEILGQYYDAVREEINHIYSLRGKSIDEAAQFVLDGEFGNNNVRKLLLDFCSYDEDKVQKRVNEILSKKPDVVKVPSNNIITSSMVSLFRDAGRANEEVDGLQGNCIIFKSGDYAIINDCYRSGAIDKIKAEIKGIKNVCVVITHLHGDHMSSNLNSLIKAKLIKKLYLPERDSGWSSKYKERYDKAIKDCKANNVDYVVLKQGSVFNWGDIKVNVIFKQNHGGINMESLILLISMPGNGNDILLPADHYISSRKSEFTYSKKVKVYCSSHHGLKLGKYSGDKIGFVEKINPDYILHTGWKAWPIGSVGQDRKTKQTDEVYQKVSNLIPGDVCGRTELKFHSDGQVDIKLEKGYTGKTVKYKLGGVTYSKTVYVCEKTKFRKVKSMVPNGAEII